MIILEYSSVFGIEGALYGMRNPYKSHSQSDSFVNSEGFVIGPKDLKLCKTLIRNGTDHRKFLRFITVQMDITAPLYWWKEYDTYKVGTVANSESTMHSITNKEFDLSDFSYDKLYDSSDINGWEDPMWLELWHPYQDQKYSPVGILGITIRALNYYRKLYLETRDKKYWWQIIQLLPSSYMQKRTVQFSYETLLAMRKARADHRLNEWHVFIDYTSKLDYVQEFGI